MMDAIPNLQLSQETLDAFCQRWKITKLELFGSVLREDFHPDSDIDVLVTFAPEAEWTLLDFVEMHDEFAELVGRKVDFVERNAVERSQNHIRRKSILNSAQVIYAV